MKARTLAPVHPSRPRMYLMCFKMYPRVSEDHPDRNWMLQMGSLGCPLSTLKQENKSMYSNTSGYVHMGLGLGWGKGITGQ